MGAGTAFNVYGTSPPRAPQHNPSHSRLPHAAESGRWQRIMALNGGTVNLNHVDLGYGGTANAAIEVQNASVQIRNSTIITATASASLCKWRHIPVIENTIIRDNATNAVFQETVDMTPAYSRMGRCSRRSSAKGRSSTCLGPTQAAPKRIARDKSYSSRKMGALAPGLGPLDSNATRDQTVAPTPRSAVETCA